MKWARFGLRQVEFGLTASNEPIMMTDGRWEAGRDMAPDRQTGLGGIGVGVASLAALST
jgi:hypothetical protein